MMKSCSAVHMHLAKIKGFLMFSWYWGFLHHPKIGWTDSSVKNLSNRLAKVGSVILDTAVSFVIQELSISDRGGVR